MRPLSIKTLALLKNNNKNKIKKKTSKKKKTAMPKCFVVVGFLFTIKLFHVVAFSSSSMLCLGRMFLIPFEAHLLALPPPKQGAAGNKCFSLADNLLALPPPKQGAAGKRCFLWQMTRLRCRRRNKALLAINDFSWQLTCLHRCCR